MAREVVKDERLYMKLPIDIHRHPKVTRLPVEVRWTFVEMIAEARVQDNDGVFSVEDAEFMWDPGHLRALLESHPARPLLVREGDSYVLREYAKHQQTRADREALSARKAEAGRKGGLSSGRARAKQVLSTSQADSSKTKQSQSQSQSQRDLTHFSESQSLNTRARDETDELSAVQQSVAAQFGIDVERVRAKVRDAFNIDLTLVNALAVGTHVLSKRDTPPDKPTAYVLGAIARTPAEIEQHIYESGFA